MVGRGKRAALNTKKTNVAFAIKKQKKLFKKKDSVSIVDKVQVEDMEVDDPSVNVQKKPKKISKKKQKKIAMNAGDPHRDTQVNSNKVKRHQLPFKETSIAGAAAPRPSSKVVSAQHISKKRAKKIEKARKRAAKEKETQENAMQD